MQTECHEQSSLLKNVNEQTEVFHAVYPVQTFTSITQVKQETVLINAGGVLWFKMPNKYSELEITECQGMLIVTGQWNANSHILK